MTCAFNATDRSSNFQAMAQPSTPGQSIFGGPTPVAATTQAFGADNSTASNSLQPTPTPPSAASSNNTYIMPNSPAKGRSVADGYRPKVTRTLGQRPACLVNASVTYCGNNQIYAFGGFDQYTDEVYNHVLRLDLVSHQWSLVDNYGDIPGVRMGTLHAITNNSSLTPSRTYCDLVPRQQTPSLWRRERTPNLPVRPHRIRSQNCTLDSATRFRPDTQRQSKTCCCSARR